MPARASVWCHPLRKLKVPGKTPSWGLGCLSLSPGHSHSLSHCRCEPSVQPHPPVGLCSAGEGAPRWAPLLPLQTHEEKSIGAVALSRSISVPASSSRVPGLGHRQQCHVNLEINEPGCRGFCALLHITSPGPACGLTPALPIPGTQCCTLGLGAAHPSAQCPAPHMWCSVPGARCCPSQCLVPGFWCPVPGTWCCPSQCPIPGAQCCPP